MLQSGMQTRMFEPPQGITKMPKLMVEQTGWPIQSGSKPTGAGAHGKNGNSKLVELELEPLPGDADNDRPRIVRPDASVAWSPLQIQLYRSQLLSYLILVGGFEPQTDGQEHHDASDISAAQCSNWVRHVQADEGVPAPAMLWMHPWQAWKYVTAPHRDAMKTGDMNRSVRSLQLDFYISTFLDLRLHLSYTTTFVLRHVLCHRSLLDHFFFPPPKHAVPPFPVVFKSNDVTTFALNFTPRLITPRLITPRPFPPRLTGAGKTFPIVRCQSKLPLA